MIIEVNTATSFPSSLKAVPKWQKTNIKTSFKGLKDWTGLCLTSKHRFLGATSHAATRKAFTTTDLMGSRTALPSLLHQLLGLGDSGMCRYCVDNDGALANQDLLRLMLLP